MMKRSLAAVAVLLGLAGPACAQPMPNIVEPSRAGRGEVLRRGANGHFFARVGVDGRPVTMMFDTGASTVSLRHEDAVAAGIDVGALDFSRVVQTANGVARVAPVLLRSVTLGDITVRDVPAIVGRPGAQGVSLLGQSFMRGLGGYRAEGDTLVLMAR